MSHLPIERLAELATEEPSADERLHLAGCAMCASELGAYQRLAALAADERRRIAPPLTDWRTLGARLREEGLVARPAREPVPGTGTRARRTLQAVAAALLLSTGVALGRFSAGLPLGQAIALADIRTGPDDGDSSNVREAAMTQEEFASTAAALAALQDAQRRYEAAALYLASHDTSTSEGASELYRTRLAALDQMAEASLQALERAPADPVMNQMYLNALGAREITLSKLGSVLPVGARLTRF